MYLHIQAITEVSISSEDMNELYLKHEYRCAILILSPSAFQPLCK